MAVLSSWLHECRYLSSPDRGQLWLSMGILRAHARDALRIAADAPAPQLVLQTLLESALATVSERALDWSPPDGWDGPKTSFELLTPNEWLYFIKKALVKPLLLGPAQIRLRLARLRPSSGGDDIALLRAAPLRIALTIGLSSGVKPVYRLPMRVASIVRSEIATQGAAADVFELSAQRANTDFLVHLGSLRELLADVLARPYSCKANVVVIRQALPAEEVVGGFFRDLRYAVRLLYASALVLIDPDMEEVDIRASLDSFARAGAFDNPFDVELARAFDSRAVVWCTAEFANQRMSEIERVTGAMPAALTPAPQATRGTELSDRKIFVETVAEGETYRAPKFSPDPEVLSVIPPRFLSQQSFRLEGEPVPAQGGFRAHTQCAVDVRVAPEDARWDSLPIAFPDHLLPPSSTSTLTVWLTEPHHIPRGVRGRMKISPDRSSSTCSLRFVVQEAGDFDGRLTVLHHGRVLQTARLVAKVLRADEAAQEEGTPCLKEYVQINNSFSGMDARGNFDIAIVTNHGTLDEPRAAVYEGEQVRITALDAAASIAAEINDALTSAAKTAADMVGGIESEKGLEFIVDLARAGRVLGVKLFQSGFERRAQTGVARNNRIQIIHTRPDGVLPLEFVYDHPAPASTAQLCPHWREAMRMGDCSGTCELASASHGAAHVCPLGFWGISKVIERHAKTQPGYATLRAEPSPASSKIDLRGNTVVAFSERVNVDPRDKLRQMLEKFPVLKPRVLASWTEWLSVVRETRPALIVSIPHADGKGTKAKLEIEGSPLGMADLQEGHVAPVVMLIGCDTAQAMAEYGTYIEMFRSCGAAVVVATISTIYGSQAAAAASRLTETIFSDAQGTTTIGEALRDSRRQALLNGEVMPLALVAYGDADWELQTGG